MLTLIGHGVVEVSAETVFAGAPPWGSCPGQGEFGTTPGEPLAEIGCRGTEGQDCILRVLVN